MSDMRSVGFVELRDVVGEPSLRMPETEKQDGNPGPMKETQVPPAVLLAGHLQWIAVSLKVSE